MTLYPPAVDHHLLRPAHRSPHSPCTTPADQEDMMLTPQAIDVWAETISIIVPISISLKSILSWKKKFQCKRYRCGSYLVPFSCRRPWSIVCKRSHPSSNIPIWKCLSFVKVAIYLQIFQQSESVRHSLNGSSCVVHRKQVRHIDLKKAEETTLPLIRLPWHTPFVSSSRCSKFFLLGSENFNQCTPSCSLHTEVEISDCGERLEGKSSSTEHIFCNVEIN